jgi:hypothetical protein
MDFQVLFNIAIGIAGVCGGWILNNISRSIEKLDEDVRNMPLTYVTQNHFQRDIDEIKSMLRLIFDRLENKQDK